jgi:hypothetical protein
MMYAIRYRLPVTTSDGALLVSKGAVQINAETPREAVLEFNRQYGARSYIGTHAVAVMPADAYIRALNQGAK